MTAPTANTDDFPVADEGAPEGIEDQGDTADALAIASAMLSGIGFLTLLRLADRRERTPARALLLFFATTLESISGTVLGLVAVGRVRDVARPGTGPPLGKGLLLGASGAVLGVITTLLNFNWMRTRRRL
jgi:hypothetical protein